MPDPPPDQTPSSPPSIHLSTVPSSFQRQTSRVSWTAPATEEHGVSSNSPALSRTRSTGSQRRWGEPVRKFWRHQISLVVPATSKRDHLALERTFLGYVRAAILLSMIGVIVAQLFRLQNTPDPDRSLGYYRLAIPISSIFIAAAIVVTLLGAVRFYRQQHAMARGKVHAGGFEVYSIMALVMGLTVMLFGLLLAVDIRQESG